MALTKLERTKTRPPHDRGVEGAAVHPCTDGVGPRAGSADLPRESKKREGGPRFARRTVDLELFRNTDSKNDGRSTIGIVKFTAPDQKAGLSQLEIFLAREPLTRFGTWTGDKTPAVYKLPDDVHLVMARPEHLDRNVKWTILTTADLGARDIKFRVPEPRLDTTDPMNKVVITTMSALPERECNLLTELTRESMARAEGPRGRPNAEALPRKGAASPQGGRRRPSCVRGKSFSAARNTVC